MVIRSFKLFLGLLLLASAAFAEERVTLNEKDDGYRGIWYMNQPLKTAYRYKYSGGLGTYCAKHKPFAVYCDRVKKTFFCYGGTTKASQKELIHMVSYYDMGSLYIESGVWRVIGPTEPWPQPYNPGGEMALWESEDRGKTWKRLKQLTGNSERNHTYARAPVNAHPDFYALWADGHGRQPSESNLYFCNRAGDVYALPRQMSEPYAKPMLVEPAYANKSRIRYTIIFE